MDLCSTGITIRLVLGLLAVVSAKGHQGHLTNFPSRLPRLVTFTPTVFEINSHQMEMVTAARRTTWQTRM